jgi:hypothetical protein
MAKIIVIYILAGPYQPPPPLSALRPLQESWDVEVGAEPEPEPEPGPGMEVVAQLELGREGMPGEMCYRLNKFPPSKTLAPTNFY